MITETQTLEDSRKENINEYINNKENILNYLRLRFKYDKELAELKIQQSNKMKPIIDEMKINYVSKQRIDSCIKLYTEKNSNIDILNVCDKIFNFITSELNAQYRYFYIESRSLIYDYITLTLLLKQEKTNIKTYQNGNIAVSKNNICNLGSFKYIQHVYNTISKEIKFYNINISQDLYNTPYFGELTSIISDIKEQIFNEQTNYKYVSQNKEEIL